MKEKELKYLKENLQKVYDLIDMLDDGEYFEDEEKEVSKKRKEVDLYQIGDIINFIETILKELEGENNE